MEQIGSYRDKLPIKTINEESTDQEIRVRLTGVSGDIIRTLVFYEVDENPSDYQVEEAFLIDDRERAYCLVSVERSKDNGKMVSWMEFGPVPPDVSSLELKITRLRQAPIFNAFKIKGRTFIDPWDIRFPLTRDQICKMDCWLGGQCDDKDDPEEDWRLRGQWSFTIPMGKWNFQDTDCLTPLNITLKMGEDTIIIREFRTSDTGAFILVESRNRALEQIGEKFKGELIRVFNDSKTYEEFQQKLALIGISRSYEPADLTLRVLDQKKMSLYSPDFRDARGVIHNRIYHFFDDLIYGKFLDVLVMEFKNLKPSPPLEIDLDFSDPDNPSTLKIDMDMGTLSIKGTVSIINMNLSDDIYRIQYTVEMDGEQVERLAVTNATLQVASGDGEPEDFPCLGTRALWDSASEKLIKYVSFPALHRECPKEGCRMKLIINAFDLKMKKPLVFPFRSIPGTPVPEKTPEK